VESKRDPTLLDLHRVSNHRIAWRCSESFTDTIGNPDPEHLLPRLRKRKQRPNERSERVPRDDQQLPFTQTIAEVTCKKLQQARHRLGKSFDYSDRFCGSAQTSCEKNRQQRINDFAGCVVEETDETDSNYVSWQTAVTTPQPREAMICRSYRSHLSLVLT